jgi:hypothetical protein
MGMGVGIAPHRLRDEIADPDLRRDLQRIFDEAAQVWSSQHLREFTLHNAPHYLQVEQNLDVITAHLQTTPAKLTQHEVFVLLAACHLHDIGMQLGVPDAREQHARYAHDLILYSSAWIGPSQRKVTLSISDTNAREAIAQVARGHWTNFALDLRKFDYVHGNIEGRLRLLGLLLANADLLDTSAIRAGYFRSSHRLFDLNPISELHQKMHTLVKGFSIRRPDPELPDKLIYEMRWRDQSETVRLMAEWQLRWFSSQMRQIAPPLENESGGAIRWAWPWARVFFRRPVGPVEELSAPARAVLVEDVRAQRRIDREAFAARFHNAMKGTGIAALVLCGGEKADWRPVTDWCDAHARAESGIRVARIDSGGSEPHDVVSLIAIVLGQWGVQLPRCDEDRAWEAFSGMRGTPEPLMLVALSDGPEPDLDAVLQAFVTPMGDIAAARVLVLATTQQSPASLGSIATESFDLTCFEEADLEKYLDDRYGYGRNERQHLIEGMRALGLLRQPANIYQYIEHHCDRAAWTMEEEV